MNATRCISAIDLAGAITVPCAAASLNLCARARNPMAGLESKIFCTPAVSVVTNGVSDDANGVDLSVTDLWLQMARAGDVFAMHYSLDGRSWRMVRLFRLAVAPAIRVGLVAQCPVGPGATVDFLSFSVENRTLQNLRGGK